MTLDPQPLSERSKRPAKTIVRPSRRSFSLGVDELTHRTLVQLQTALTTRRVNPSRTLVTRKAILRYGQEVRVRIANGDREWLEHEVAVLRQLGQRGVK